MRILMVCLGNICRSPLAEGIMRHQIKTEGLTWNIDSAGTGAWHAGEKPDPRSIEVAHRNGIDITGQRARQFVPLDFDRFDHIFVMDAENLKNVLALAPHDLAREKVEMIMNRVYPNENRRVPDPYYGGKTGFDDVFEMLEEACKKIISEHL